MDFSTAQVMVSPGLMVRELLPIQPPVGFLSGRVGGFYHRRSVKKISIQLLEFLQASYADNARHYGYYIDGDIAKLPGGGRRGAAVLCELIPGELASDPNPHQPTPASDVGGAGSYGSYPGMGQGGYRDGRNGAYPSRGRYPSQDDGGYPSYPQGR